MGRENEDKLLSLDFKTDTPVLSNVVIVDEWCYHDGTLFGVCEINKERFFYIDVIYDIWRFYDDNTHQRLWAIYGVYDIDIGLAEKLSDAGSNRGEWQEEIQEKSNCIGIFWDYEYAEGYER